MLAKDLINLIKGIGIQVFTGIPDSLLQEFCYELNYGDLGIENLTPSNEGAAVAIAAGTYLNTGFPACVYMQNSGIGNAVNPIVSLLHKSVYDIPALFVIGWRGEPGIKDEPQHVCQGEITIPQLELLGLTVGVIDAETNLESLVLMFKDIKNTLHQNGRYAILVKKNAFEKTIKRTIQNKYTLTREDAISIILPFLDKKDAVISTTGKISREVYEQSEIIYGNHNQDFLTVGSMGHASMLALAFAKGRSSRVYCFDGDGAVFMHMGSLLYIAKQNPENLVHIVLNNDAHESVGGMPTGAAGTLYSEIAKSVGYPRCFCIDNEKELNLAMKDINQNRVLTLLEIKVAMASRDNLGRPKETPVENKLDFMKYHESIVSGGAE